MDFEFDPAKSASNQQKHGITFQDAAFLWDDTNRLIIPAKNLEEPRFALIGELCGSIWVAIYTERNNKVRIISVRHARPEEKELYYGH